MFIKGLFESIFYGDLNQLIICGIANIYDSDILDKFNEAIQ